MTTKFKFYALCMVAIAGTLFSGCKKILDEHPFTVFTPEYFKTPSGMQSAVNALYSGMRFIYGPEGAVAVNEAGTDEYLAGDQTRSGAAGDLLTIANYTLGPTNGAILTPWNRSFNNINLANAVVNFAPDVALDTSLKSQLVAEARFLRGLYYLGLVSQFGAVPVDLGTGDFQFNQNPYQGFNRLPMADVLVKDYQGMIDDFTYASQILPDKRPAGAFKLSKAAAFLMLARTYIFRAYSTAKQSTDFDNAYNAAITVINNPSKYVTGLVTGLLQDYGDVHKEGNDYNQEILFSIERIPGDVADNESTTNQGIGAGKGVDASNDFNPDYTSVESPKVGSGIKPSSTRVSQYGRPIRRFAPTPWTFNTAFADKINDSRFDGTFRMVWFTTTAVTGFAIGDTSFMLAKTNAIADSMNVIPKKYRVVAPREFYYIGTNANGTPNTSQNIYPAISKYEDSKKASFNDPGGRPFVVAKFSELYLLAAEAAFQKGDLSGAATLLNVLRERAAYRVGLSPTVLTARKAAMDITSAQVTLDFILDERVRELCGESVRWNDLARRNKLIERVKLYNPDGSNNITPNKHELRPIPQSQLDNTVDADNNKAKYQNPGY